MKRVFKEYLDHILIRFIDDVMIYSRLREEHEKHFQMELETLHERSYSPNLKSVSFG